MEAVAKWLDDGNVVQEIGTVTASPRKVTADPELLFVTTPRGRYRAELALSCLVEPCEGDQVLVATQPNGQAFVLAVLRRPSEAKPRLRFEGDVEVAAGGRIAFVANGGVDIATPADVNVMSAKVDVRAREASFVLDAVSYVGRVARIDADKVKSVVQLFDQVVDRFHQKAKRSYRFIEEVDVTRASEIDLRAKENLSMRGRNAVVNAEQLVKVDGRQIHLG